MHKKSQIRREIRYWIAIFSSAVGLENAVGFFDYNRQAQEFYADLGNILFNLNLIDLDKSTGIHNYPHIDLGDSNSKICIQVTSDNTSTKIKSAIDGYIEKKYYQEYDRIVIWIIGKKKDYSTTFDCGDLGENYFNQETDIRDDNYIVKHIETIDDTNKLEEIRNFLSSNISTKSLIELTKEEMEFGINLLHQCTQENYGPGEISSSKIQNRGDGFITRKNEENNMTEEHYSEYISPDLIHNENLLEYLHNLNNEESKNKYIEICESIQQQYIKEKDKYGSIDSIINEIYNYCTVAMNLKDSFDSRKLSIILHNMYFICDIGINPND